MSLVGFYPGSFDPVTNGHIDIIQRSLKFLDELVIGVGVHHGKVPYLSGAERVQLIERLVPAWREETGKAIQVIEFDCLAVEAAERASAGVIIRGVRDAVDFAYEIQMAGMNLDMASGLETIMLPSDGRVCHITGKLVRQIANFGGDISSFVPRHVAEHLSGKAKSD